MKRTRHPSTFKGRVVKGRAERVPKDALLGPPLQESLKNELNNVSGIYALYDIQNLREKRWRRKYLYYVGIANDLYGRIFWHTKDKHKKKWNFFSVFVIPKKQLMKDLETIIARIVWPRGNKQLGKFPKHHELQQILKRAAIEEKERSKDYIRALKE